MSSQQQHQDTHNNDKYTLDLQNDLDKSVQEEETQYKRDSSIGQFNFQHQEQHHFNQLTNSNTMMGDSQFSQEGVFSYNDDYRMRQSMKSDQQCQLEDIGGNADMTDRNKSAIKGTINKTQDNSINIVEHYQPSQQPIEINQNNHDNKSQQKQSQVQQQQLYQQKNDRKLQQQHIIETSTFNVQQQSNQIQHQITSKTEYKVVQNSNRIEATAQTKNNNESSATIDNNNKVIEIQQEQKTPQKKSSTKIQQQQQIIDPKQQWSNQSNKSFSPILEPDLYSKPQPKAQNAVKTNLLASIRQQQSPIKSKQNLQQSPQKPKITLLKQSLIVQEKPTSSIRDWFRTSSNKTNEEKPSKQYNPNVNQIPSPIKQSKEDAKQKYRRQMQAQMQGFQQSLNKLQKNNINKSTQINKQRQKANKTHLPQTITKNTLNNITQPASQDLRMLLKICVQKKKENYVMVRQWDKKRAQTMNLHRNVIQMLQNQIDKRIKSSLQNFEIYSNFFKEKLKQEEKFTTSPVISTKYALQNNAISKNIYINCSVILNSLSEENQAKCKKVQDFITLIKNDILKDLIETHMHDSQRELLKVREKISTLKSSLKKYNGETQEKSQQLAKLFTQATVSVRPSNDFYTNQLQFLRSASQQVFIQKRLGENCLQYYHTALNEQFKRAKVIRQALLTYSKGLKQTYNIQLQQVGLQQLSKTQEIKLIEQFYSLDEMFDQRTGNMLKERFNLPLHEDLTIDHVTKFVETFEYETFNNRMLLLKQFSAKYYAAVNKDFKTPRQQNCHIVITVDFYLHLFFSPDKSSLKPDISLKITPKQLQIKPQRQQFIDIIKKQEKRPSMISYFWQSKNQRVYRVKFPSKDSKELFYDYLNKLLS